MAAQNSQLITIDENRDIEYSGFKLHKLGVTPVGTPTYEQWLEANEFVKKANGAVHFWIGDLLNYGEREYGENYTQAIDHSGYEYQTVANDKWIANKIPLSLRRESLTPDKAKIIASMETEEMKDWIETISETPMTVRELRNEVKKAKALKSPTPQLPEGKYDVIYADPPWEYSNSGISGAAENHYSTMPTEKIMLLSDNEGNSVMSVFPENAVLFMWVTNPLLEDGLKVLKSWGFEYKTNVVWIKDKAGQGFYVKGQHELLLIAVKGSHRPDDSLYIRSVVEHPRLEHSQKPEVFYELIETLYPDGKYLELFARNSRDKWTSWGNEV